MLQVHQYKDRILVLETELTERKKEVEQLTQKNGDLTSLVDAIQETKEEVYVKAKQRENELCGELESCKKRIDEQDKLLIELKNDSANKDKAFADLLEQKCNQVSFPLFIYYRFH